MPHEAPQLMYLPPVETPAGLFEKIIAKIHALQIRNLRISLSLAIAGALASLLYVVINWSAILIEVQQSSFIQMLKLADTDSDVVFSNLKDLTLGLIESIPAETVLFVSVFTFCIVLAIDLVSSLRQTRHASFIHHIAS